MKIAVYMPCSDIDSDPSKKFETESECREYIFSRMCPGCKQMRETYLEMVRNGYSDSDEDLPEIYHDNTEYPACSAEWMIIDEKDTKPGFGQVECNNCGGFFDLENVQWGPDPFASEISDDYTKMYLCDGCYYESCMDI